MESCGCVSASKRTKQDPIEPAPPVTRILMPDLKAGYRAYWLLVLQLPIVIDVRVVIGNSTLVRGIVEAIRDVDQHGRVVSQHLVSVTHTGWNTQFPGTQRADVQSVGDAEGWRLRSQIVEKYLNH